MRDLDGRIFLSATDLMSFTGCAHATTLDLAHMRGTGPEPGDDTEDAALLQKQGDAHEAAHLLRLKEAGRTVMEIERGKLGENAEATRAALAAGPDVMFQGAFLSGNWGDWSDFLERVETPSALGSFSYEVADTKLKRRADPKHVLQLVLYSDLLAEIQGVVPEFAHVELGDGTRATLRLADYSAYARMARGRLEAFVADLQPTRPVPCADCGLCRWADHCNSVWQAEDSLFNVANISRGQVKKLEAAGVDTLEGLSTLDRPIRGMAENTLARLVTQAKQIADITLYGTWKERTSFTLTLPPQYVRIEPTDIITATVNNVPHEMRVLKTDMEANGVMKISAVAEDISSYDFYTPPGETSSNLQPPVLVPETLVQFIDAPPLPTDTVPNQGLLRIGVDADSLRRSTYTDDEYRRISRALITYTSNKTVKAEFLSTEEQFTRQLVRHFFLIGTNTMMRFGELYQLKWGNVETYSADNQRLVTINVLAETSKVRQSRVIKVRGGKHFDRLRCLSKHTKQGDWVFTAHNGERVTRDALYYHYAQLMALAGITDWKERNLTYYSTRHYGITKRLQSNANPLTLSKVCGTSLKHLTETYYHADLTEQERAALLRYEGSAAEVVELD